MTSSNNIHHGTADMLMLLLQSDPSCCGSGKVSQYGPSMYSPPPLTLPPPPAATRCIRYPTENDVIYGRGVANARTHLFCEQVCIHQDAYIHGDPVTQRRIVKELRDWVQQEQEGGGGRFLLMDSGSRWVEMDESAVNVRIRQSLLDSYRNSNKKNRKEYDDADLMRGHQHQHQHQYCNPQKMT